MAKFNHQINSALKIVALTSGILAMPVMGAKQTDSLVIKNVSIVSAHLQQPLENQWIKIDGGKISAISSSPLSSDNAQIVDGTGQFITPGLMDSHVHIGGAPGLGYGDFGPVKNHPELAASFAEQLPKSFLYWGVTEILEPGGAGESLRQFNQQPLHPDAIYCGAVPINGGYPMVFMPEDKQLENFPNFVFQEHHHHAPSENIDASAHTPEKVVADVVAQGADCVKIYIEDGFGGASIWPLISTENIQRIKKATHEHGLKLVAHANAIDMQRIAVETEVDVIAHGLWNWLEYGNHKAVHPAIAAHLDNVIEKQITFQPTMRVIPGLKEMYLEKTLDNPELKHVVPKALLDWYKTEEAQWFPNEVRNENGKPMSNEQLVRNLSWVEERGKRAITYLANKDYPLILASDYPSSPTYANQPGYTTYQEILAMENAGVSLKRIFEAATVNNAETFGIQDQYGTVEVGKKANLLLLGKNPWETSTAYNSIDKVILRGKVIERETLSASYRK